MSDQTQALVPAASGEPVKQLSQEGLAAVQRKLHEAVAAAEEAMEMLRGEVGPNPGKIPAELMTQISMGAGYFRAPRDTINRLFAEWRAVVRQANCPHDRGLVHMPKRAYCRLCGWEFVQRGDLGWVAMERTGR